MNYKSINTIPIFFIMIFALYSCTKDNPVIPPEETGLDSARYTYTVDTLFQFVADITPFDTNGILILTTNNLIKYNGSNYQDYPLSVSNFTPGYVVSINNSLAYISGANLNPSSKSKTRLLKWDGSSITELFIPFADSNSQPIGLIYPFSESEIWLCGVNEDIIKFDGSNFEYFDLDSGYKVRPVFKVNNQIFCAAIKSYIDSTYTYSITTLNIYGYQNNQWDLYYSDTTETGSNHYFPGPYRTLIKDNMYASLSSTLYEFNGNMFSPVLTSNEIYLGFDLAGQSLSNLMVIGGELPKSGLGLYHWNGIKWSREISSNELSIFPLVQMYKLVNTKEQYFLMGKGFNTPFLLYNLKPK